MNVYVHGTAASIRHWYLMDLVSYHVLLTAF
jgi:hypothetical protein